MCIYIVKIAHSVVAVHINYLVHSLMSIWCNRWLQNTLDHNFKTTHYRHQNILILLLFFLLNIDENKYIFRLFSRELALFYTFPANKIANYENLHAVPLPCMFSALFWSNHEIFFAWANNLGMNGITSVFY